MSILENVLKKPGFFNRIVDAPQKSPLDEVLLERILERMWKEQSIRILDYQDIGVDVNNGEVLLSGHVSKSLNKYLAEECAKKVERIRSVRNNIIVDDDLRVMVAHALAADPHTRPYDIHVGCHHGWINLTGAVPDDDVRSRIEWVVSGVPYVRGVIGLPRIVNEAMGIVRRRIQPEVGSEVIGKDGLVGVVSKVVINPRGRLVSHLLIQKFEIQQGTRVAREFSIPIDNVASSRLGTIWLDRNLGIDRLNLADPKQYSVPSDDWIPPFPYKHGQVFWRIEFDSTYREKSK